MTAFVLVAGGYIGGWVWREVEHLLRDSGHFAYPATLTGFGDRRHLAGPETDLETHIEDLVQLIDHVDEPEVVLVGHCYGIYPAVGAADRRPERVERIVYLDSPMPQDGYSMLDQVREQMADQAVRDRVLTQAEQAEDGWRVTPPTLEDWRTHGNVVGVSEDDLVRLARLAAPQPLGTMTRPLRLSGAASAKAVMSGVFCTVDGVTIDMVQGMLAGMAASGDSRLEALTDPRSGFFELATGHWPMLSTPDELTAVLLRAAADEGHRLTAPAAAG